MKGERVEFGASAPRMRARFIQFLIMLVLKFFFRLCQLLYRLEIVGRDHIPATGPCIFMGNHSSKLFDGLLVYFVKRTRPDAYFYGQGGAHVRFASITKAMGEATLSQGKGVGQNGPLLWMALKILQNGRPIGIATENMEWDGRLQPLKPGPAWLALRSGAPVAVIVLRGGYSIWPRWAKFPKLTGRLEIRIGRPFTLLAPLERRITDEMIQDANRKIADEMNSLLERKR